MTHETAGDPVSGLKWTHRTTAKLAHELRGLGIHVCPQTVARLLKAMGYSLRVNHKKLAGASHPNRDQPPCRVGAVVRFPGARLFLAAVVVPATPEP